jgi:hypothetical protein
MERTHTHSFLNYFFFFLKKKTKDVILPSFIAPSGSKKNEESILGRASRPSQSFELNSL